MKTLVSLICSVLLSSYTIAQDHIVNIDFEVDGKPSVYKNATVLFFYNKDTIRTSIDGGKLIIPESVLRKKATVVFYINKYLLRFDSIPVSLNTYSPKWTIGVDKKPFDKKKLWEIKSWEKVQIVYYLHNDNGRTFTVDYYKKSEVIRK